jgi:hypothetical protein
MWPLRKVITRSASLSSSGLCPTAMTLSLIATQKSHHLQTDAPVQQPRWLVEKRCMDGES